MVNWIQNFQNIRDTVSLENFLTVKGIKKKQVFNKTSKNFFNTVYTKLTVITIIVVITNDNLDEKSQQTLNFLLLIFYVVVAYEFS